MPGNGWMDGWMDGKRLKEKAKRKDSIRLSCFAFCNCNFPWSLSYRDTQFALLSYKPEFNNSPLIASILGSVTL